MNHREVEDRFESLVKLSVVALEIIKVSKVVLNFLPLKFVRNNAISNEV